jgi:5-methylcytosine-specific restriction endonuclease McrA
VCSATYRPTYGQQRTCGRMCGAELQRRNGCYDRTSQRVRWPSSKVHIRDCVQCERLFVARRATQTICSDTCRRRRLISQVLDRHYGFVRDAMREGPLLDYLTKRDHGRCGICNKPVRAKTGPMRASIDHIVPRSISHDDSLTNLQLAHWKCNTTKSNRGGGEQLLLVG